MRKLKDICSLLFFALALFPCTMHAQKYSGLADTPPMGWNSWNKFHCDINEDLIKNTIDAIEKTGLKDAGYVYVNLDDCWHGERDSLGFIHEHPEKFKSGIKSLSDYAHSKGMKLGIYSCCGNLTCAGFPGSLGHEYQDACQYAKWGIDYLKLDWCNTDNLNSQGAYTVMRDAIRKAGRPMILSMCEWGVDKPWEWAKEVGHCWRTTYDIQNSWESIMYILSQQVNLRAYAGPGHWNDPDMLEVGNGLPVNEDRAHFTMWCMLAAPLILGNDISNMSKETAVILLNKDLIAIDQDKLGIQGLKLKSEDGLDFWFKPLFNGDWAFCILNCGGEPKEYTIDWKKFNFKDDVSNRQTDFTNQKYSITNLWTKKKEGLTTKNMKVVINPHDVVVLRLNLK